MSEPSAKQRLRRWKRKIATDLTLAGYEVETYDSGPFHLGTLSYGGRSVRKIRICFDYVTEDDTKPLAALKANCLREIWQISNGGREVVKVKITPSR